MFAAVRLGKGYGPLRYGSESRMLTNRPPVRMAAHACERTWARSASGEIRSFSMNRCRKRRVRGRLRTDRHHVRDVPRDSLGIAAQCEVREDLFERAAREQRAKLLHRVVCDNAPLKEDDDARAKLFDRVEDMRRVENR